MQLRMSLGNTSNEIEIDVTRKLKSNSIMQLRIFKSKSIMQLRILKSKGNVGDYIYLYDTGRIPKATCNARN